MNSEAWLFLFLCLIIVSSNISFSAGLSKGDEDWLAAHHLSKSLFCRAWDRVFGPLLNDLPCLECNNVLSAQSSLDIISITSDYIDDIAVRQSPGALTILEALQGGATIDVGGRWNEKASELVLGEFQILFNVNGIDIPMTHSFCWVDNFGCKNSTHPGQAYPCPPLPQGETQAGKAVSELLCLGKLGGLAQVLGGLLFGGIPMTITLVDDVGNVIMNAVGEFSVQNGTLSCTEQVTSCAPGSVQHRQELQAFQQMAAENPTLRSMWGENLEGDSPNVCTLPNVECFTTTGCVASLVVENKQLRSMNLTGLLQLTRLRMSNNPDMVSFDPGSAPLIVLLASNAGLKSLVQGPFLFELDISFNPLITGEFSFLKTPYLLHLHGQSTGLTSITNIHVAYFLQELLVENTNVSSISEFGPEQCSIDFRFLDVSNAQLTAWPDGLENCQSLVTIIARNMSNLPPISVVNITQLTNVWAQGMGLNQIWEGLCGNPKLVQLYVDNNELYDTLDECFNDMPQLKLLGIGGNGMSKLPSSLPQVAAQLTSLWINDNPWPPQSINDFILTTLDTTPAMETLVTSNSQVYIDTSFGRYVAANITKNLQSWTSVASIAFIPEPIFRGQLNLQTILLNDNPSLVVPFQGLCSATRLETLDVSFTNGTNVAIPDCLKTQVLNASYGNYIGVPSTPPTTNCSMLGNRFSCPYSYVALAKAGGLQADCSLLIDPYDQLWYELHCPGHPPIPSDAWVTAVIGGCLVLQTACILGCCLANGCWKRNKYDTEERPRRYTGLVVLVLATCGAFGGTFYFSYFWGAKALFSHPIAVCVFLVIWSGVSAFSDAYLLLLYVPLFWAELSNGSFAAEPRMIRWCRSTGCRRQPIRVIHVIIGLLAIQVILGICGIVVFHGNLSLGEHPMPVLLVSVQLLPFFLALAVTVIVAWTWPTYYPHSNEISQRRTINNPSQSMYNPSIQNSDDGVEAVGIYSFEQQDLTDDNDSENDGAPVQHEAEETSLLLPSTSRQQPESNSERHAVGPGGNIAENTYLCNRLRNIPPKFNAYRDRCWFSMERAHRRNRERDGVPVQAIQEFESKYGFDDDNRGRFVVMIFVNTVFDQWSSPQHLAHVADQLFQKYQGFANVYLFRNEQSPSEHVLEGFSREAGLRQSDVLLIHVMTHGQASDDNNQLIFWPSSLELQSTFVDRLGQLAPTKKIFFFDVCSSRSPPERQTSDAPLAISGGEPLLPPCQNREYFMPNEDNPMMRYKMVINSCGFGQRSIDTQTLAHFIISRSTDTGLELKQDEQELAAFFTCSSPRLNGDRPRSFWVIPPNLYE